MKSPLKIAIFGATGQVGRQLVSLVCQNPHYTITHLVGSPESTGRDYQSIWDEKETLLAQHYGPWVTPLPYPSHFPSQPVSNAIDISADTLVLSSVPERAGDDEDTLSRRGCRIISNSPHRRMDPSIPLIVPGIPYSPGASYIKIPNCTTIGLALGLNPIADLLHNIPLSVSTYQSISGRGDAKYPQELAVGNVFPLRRSAEATEDRIIDEIGRLLPAIQLSISCYRTPTPVGHLMDVALFHGGHLSLSMLKDKWARHITNGNHSQLTITDELYAPQSFHSAMNDNGMGITIGNFHDDPRTKIIRFSIVINNLIRGAAGSLIMAAESFNE